MAATWRDILLLTALAALGQFANNIYLPSLPAIAQDLKAPPALIQLTMTAFLASIAGTQLIYGPLSDRFGRRPITLIGGLLFLAGTALCIVAHDPVVLIVARALQAAGAGAGVVMSRAIARDLFDGPELARVFALVTIAFGLVPAVVPLLGGVLQHFFGWHASFVVTFAMGSLVIVVFARSRPETLTRPLDRIDAGTVARAYASVLVSRTFMGNALAGAGALGGLFAFFTGSPFVLMEVLGVSPLEYGFYPPIAVLGFVSGAALSRRWADKVGPMGVARRGLVLLAAGAFLMAVPPLVGCLNKFQINGAILVWVAGLGMVMPSVTAAAITPFAGIAGTASAMLGFLQMGAAAVASVMVGLAGGWIGVHAFPAVMVGCAVIAILGFSAANLSLLGRPASA